MKKLTSFGILLVLFTLQSNHTLAQLKVKSTGSVKINSFTPAWGSAIRATVHDYNACSYHLKYNGTDRFFVHASGYLWCQKGGYFGSDLQLKEDISDIDKPLQKIRELNGIQFKFKNSRTKHDSPSSKNKNSGFRMGLIAQEVEKTLPGIVKTMPDETKAVAYTDLIPLLIEAMKIQEQRIQILQKNLSSLKNRIPSITKTDTTNYKNKSVNVIPSLSQNRPNPFDNKTEINYFLPKNIDNASIFIYDLRGAQLKHYELNTSGQGSIIIRGSTLQPGMYKYVLVINGKIIDSKRMILTDL